MREPQLGYSKTLIHIWKGYDVDLLSYIDIYREYKEKLGVIKVKQLLVIGPSDNSMCFVIPPMQLGSVLTVYFLNILKFMYYLINSTLYSFSEGKIMYERGFFRFLGHLYQKIFFR